MLPSNINARLAVDYARTGVKVFPCRESDTDTRKAKSPYTRNGFRGASADYSDLRRWSIMHPAATYGLPCAPNNIFVLDADRHGEGDGVHALMTLFAHFRFDWQTVPTVRTPRDGLHILFSRPTALGLTKGTIARAIDVRNNAYIIAPGTVLPDGRRYELIGGTTAQLARAIAERSLLPMPDWLIELAVQPMKPAPVLAPLSRDGMTRRIDGLIATVEKAAVGGRNATLHWAACRAGELVSSTDISAGQLSGLLVQAGLSVGLHEHEVRNTVASGMRNATGFRHGK